MKTGYTGTFVISWAQTEIDGLGEAPQTSLNVGATWAWQGDAVRVDGPNNILRLDGAEGPDQLRKRASRVVHKLTQHALQNRSEPLDLGVAFDPEYTLPDRSFVVTDGAQSYAVTLIDTGPMTRPLLMFSGGLPPRNTDMWVVHHSLGAPGQNPLGEESGGVICFTPGTRILTPNGPCLIEDLRPGDAVQTKDNGPQPVQWIGSRIMTGARLFAMPHLRPIRFRHGALGIDRPDHELLVSPGHRMVVKGAVARDLFNTSEVLVTASELVNGSSIAIDLNVRSVRYIHVLLDHHQILFANGVETESYHPANTTLGSLTKQDRAELLALCPDLQDNPLSYGPYARRNLSTSEAALLRHAA